MRLDRNIPGNDGRGKYALLLMRRLAEFDDQKAFGGLDPKIAAALKTLEDAGLIDYGEEGSASEFFVIRLKDRSADFALMAYAAAAGRVDKEYGRDVFELAFRSGFFSEFCKDPD